MSPDPFPVSDGLQGARGPRQYLLPRFAAAMGRMFSECPDNGAAAKRASHDEAAVVTDLRGHPSSRHGAEQPNSARDSERARLLELCTPIIQKLEKEGDKLTHGPLTHNASFWTTFSRSLVVEISGRLLARPGHQRNEAEVRHELLTPLLRRIAHSLHY